MYIQLKVAACNKYHKTQGLRTKNPPIGGLFLPQSEDRLGYADRI